jgi:hypothetical protein
MENVLVEAFVTKAPVKALDEDVLDRLSRCDVVPSDVAFSCQRMMARSEPGAVVADDHQRPPAGRNNGIKLVRHPSAGDRRVDDQR